MDISTLKPSERVVEILNPATGEELGIKVSVLSVNDPELKRIKRKFTDERLRLESKGKTFKAVDIESNEDELLFSAMKGWVWEKDTSFKGEKPDFNRKNVFAVFEELPWFRTQVAVAVGEEEAFFQI